MSQQFTCQSKPTDAIAIAAESFRNLAFRNLAIIVDTTRICAGYLDINAGDGPGRHGVQEGGGGGGRGGGGLQSRGGQVRGEAVQHSGHALAALGPVHRHM